MATADHASSGGVKTLRAMFESANVSTDTDTGRGRANSSNSNGTGNRGDDIPRPLSKVRTAFVPVEGDTPPAHAKSVRRPVISRVDSLKTGGPHVAERPGGQVKSIEEGNLSQKSSPQENDLSNLATSLQTPTKSDQNITIMASTGDLTSNGEAKSPTTTRVAKNDGKAPSTPSIARKGAGSKKPQPLHAGKARSIPHQSTPSHKLMSQAQTPSDLSTKPSATKAPKTSQNSTHTPQLAPADRGKTLPSFARGTASNASKAKISLQYSSIKQASRAHQTTEGTRSATGFVKPRPRSPTRPIALPAHLVASTASSAAKRSETPTFELPLHTKHNRRQSTFSIASSKPSISNLHGASQAASVSRKASATFGPPPRRKPTPTSPDPVARPPDSFLQRMMRPTASSASKVRDGPEDASNHQRPRVASRLGGPRVASAMSNPSKMKSMQNLRKSSSNPKSERPSTPRKKTDEVGGHVAHETASESSTADKTASSTATLVPEDEKRAADHIPVVDEKQPTEQIPLEDEKRLANQHKEIIASEVDHEHVSTLQSMQGVP